MRKNIVYLLSLCLACLAACDRPGRFSPLFQEAERVMPQHPDSALTLLERISDPESLSRKDKARYYLLLTEAQDKTYAPHTTDSLIAIATDYYEKTDDPARKAKAWYYRGRINQDLDKPLKAQEYYLKALREEEKIEDHALLGRVNNYVGMLYTYQNVYEQSVPYLKKAYSYFQSINDSIGQTYVLADLARAYQSIGKPDSSLYLYEQALPYARKAEVTTIPSELASLYLNKKMYDEAYPLIQKSLAWTDTEKYRYPIYLTLGEYFLYTNQMDSSELYLTKALHSPSLYTRAGGCQYLYRLNRLKKDWNEAIRYNDRYEQLRDSIERITRMESIRMSESLYDYKELTQALSLQELTIIQKSRNQLLYAFLLVLLLFICSLLYIKWKTTKEKFIKREEELTRSLEKQQERNKAQKEEIEKQILQLQKEINDVKEQKDRKLRTALLQLEEQRLKAYNDLINNEESKLQLKTVLLQKSDIYQKLHKHKHTLIKSKDWEMLEVELNKTYEQFTVRLKQMCPQILDIELKACMLTKIELSANQITNLLSYNSSVLRPRIYKKIHGEKGTVEDFVKFILRF